MIGNGMRAALLGLGIGAVSASAAMAEKWDMALAYSASNYHSETAAAFASEVTDNTGGALEIVTHPSGSLFGGAEIYGAVRRGLAPIGERLISALGNEDPFFEIDSIPFLATSFDEARKLYELSKPTLIEKLEADRLHFLYSCPWPPQGFYTVRAAEAPEDIAGLKFRAYNATTSRLAELLGMAPTKIEAAELAQAFATGVADAMITSGATGYDRKIWEHVGYYYDVKAWLPRNMVIVNARAWAGLDDATRAIIETAAGNAEADCWAKAEELDSWYVEQFKENGMTVATLNDKMQVLFQEAGETLKQEWLASAGDEGKAVIAAFEAE